MTNRARSAIPLLAAASFACASGGGDSERSAFAVLDSAGIEIADIAHPVWTDGESWTAGAEPVLEIGALEGDEAYQLYRVSRAIRLPNRSIVIANGGTSQLRWFDADGRFVRNAGGQGEGPGEFSRLFGLSLAGDVLLAHDYTLARVTRFDTAGTLLGTVQLAGDPGRPIEVWPTDSGYVGMIPELAYDVTADPTYHRRNVTYVRYAVDGALIDTLAVLPGPEMVVSGGPVAGGFTMSMTSPLIAHTSQQAVIGSRLVAGNTEHFELRVYGPDGSLNRLTRDPSRDLPVEASEWDAVVAENMADAETPDERRAVQELATLRPAPATRPAFDRFLADRAGYLWVAPFRPGAGPAPWLVVDIDGGVLGSVDLPEGLRPTDIGEDYVLGVIRDDLDVEQVRMYPLHRTR
ncbi:MAG: 6-bladed beta-propeller [Gemmatimonadota bacterium]|jgi:hypothetical protein